MKLIVKLLRQANRSSHSSSDVRPNSRLRFPSGLADRGAVLVEAVIVAPILLLLIGLTIEVSLLVSTGISIDDSTKDAARIAAIARNETTSDAEIVARVISETSPHVGQLQRVVVFEAMSPSDQPSDLCMAGTPSAGDRCNVYSQADFTTIDTSIGCASTSLDRFYCPASRDAEDYIGVWVRFDQTQLFGLTNTFRSQTSTSVQEIEPEL